MTAFRDNGGFSLIELLAVVALIGILVAMAIPRVTSAIEDARYSRAEADLAAYRTEILHQFTLEGEVPSSWSDLGYDSPPIDPWGNEYVYNSHAETSRGDWRKDGPTVPINNYFDLFSPGPDGEWVPPIQADPSRDDVIVARDGQFIGRAEDF